MKWFSALSAIKELLVYLDKFLKWLKLQKMIAKITGASHESLQKKDQRPLENVLSDDPGKPSDTKYSGMYEREEPKQD